MNKLSIKSLSLAVLIASLWGCNTTRIVKPLAKGETRISGDLGGPIVGFPIPMSSIACSYGITDKLSAFGGFHTTTLAYQALQFDFGVNYGFFKPNNKLPGLSGNLILNPIVDLRKGNSSIFPETAFNFYWLLKEKHIPYIGVTNWYDIGYNSTELAKGKLLHPTLLLGYNFEGTKWIFGLETKWMNFNKTLHIPQVTQTAIGGKGAVSLNFKIAYRIMKK